MRSRLFLALKPFPDETREKIELIKRYQSERTAREFKENIEAVIESALRSARIRMRTPFFGANEYQLHYVDNNISKKLILLKSKTVSIAGYMSLEQTLKADQEKGLRLEVKKEEIIVAGYPAYQLRYKRGDIFIGRTNPLDYIPVLISIDDKEYINQR